MNELLIYLLKSTLCLSLLYLAFRTVMRKETFFALNRFVLLAIVSCSIIIPLLQLPQSVRPMIQEQILPQIQFQEIQIQSMQATEKISEDQPLPWSFGQIILLIYLAGMMVSLLYFIHGIFSVLLMIRKAQTIKKDGYRLFILEKDIPAFSFWRMIFISRADYNEYSATILAHEQQHIRLGHFYDLMLMELAKMAYWFNPVIYWLIQDLKAIHEYQADQHTLTKGIDATKYQLLIIEKGVGHQRLALANSFNHCQIKKRITMMNKQKTGKAWRWKVATFLPLLALLLMAFGREGENVQINSPSERDIVNQEKTIAKESVAQSNDSVNSNVEVMPQFPGGDRAIQKFLNENIKYPKEAEAKHIQGKVFVNFIITDEGKVTNPKVVKSENLALDAEALRLISNMPTWTPAKVKGKYVRFSYTMPINFVLSPGPSDKNVKNNSTSEKEFPKQSNDSISSIPDVLPQFPGGEMTLRKWLAENIKYPEAAKGKIQGKVFVSFIIDDQGNVTNPKVVRSINPELDAEAIRVISIMPKWTPAKNKGKNVRTSYTIPINFVLQ